MTSPAAVGANHCASLKRLCPKLAPTSFPRCNDVFFLCASYAKIEITRGLFFSGHFLEIELGLKVFAAMNRNASFPIMWKFV
jgi:hypothetical protein